jgi:hypothetical protein
VRSKEEDWFVMNEKMIACCGLTCTDCGAYIAKRTNDDELKQKTAAMWSSPDWKVVPEEINCDGCMSTGGVLFKHCAVCEVRACVFDRGLDNCAHCDEFGCDKIEGLLKMMDGSARKTLDVIRTSR